MEAEWRIVGRIIVTKVKCWSCIPWQCSISISDEDKEGYCDTELQITSDTFSTFINVLYNKLFSLIHIININNTVCTYDLTYVLNKQTPTLGKIPFALIKYCNIVYHCIGKTRTFTWFLNLLSLNPLSVGCGQIIRGKLLSFCYHSVCTGLDPYRLSVVIRWD